MSILLDANVISELIRKLPDPAALTGIKGIPRYCFNHFHESFNPPRAFPGLIWS